MASASLATPEFGQALVGVKLSADFDASDL